MARVQVSQGRAQSEAISEGGARGTAESGPVPAQSPQQATAAGATDRPGPGHSEIDQLRAEVSQLRAELDRLRSEVEDIWANLR